MGHPDDHIEGPRNNGPYVPRKTMLLFLFFFFFFRNTGNEVLKNGPAVKAGSDLFLRKPGRPGMVWRFRINDAPF